MSTGLRDGLTVLMVAGLVFFTNLGSYPLFDEDEPKNAVCAKEMFARGDWIVPTFNEDLRTDKPILIYWLMLTSFHCFGVSEFSARLGSALLSLGTALATYLIGRKLYDRQVGLLAGVTVVTCLMFSAVGRAVTPDATLVCCLTWCFYGFVQSRVDQTGDTPVAANRFRLFSTPAALLAYVGMGFAMLAKGPVGFLLPCTAIGLFGICSQVRDDLAAGRARLGDGTWWKTSLRLCGMLFSPVRFARSLWEMKLWFGIPIAFGIALPWYFAVYHQTDGEWLRGFLGKHNVQRFTNPMENHRGLFFYYIPVLLAGTFPWSIFLPTALVEIVRRIRGGMKDADSDLFLACWALTWLVFFSIAQTKLPNYILPIYPAVAVIVARSLIGWMRTAPECRRNFLLECRFLALVGAVMIGGVWVAMSILLPAEQPLALLGVIPIATAALAFRLARKEQREQAVMICAAGAALLAIGITGWAPVELAPYQDSPFFAAAARDAAGGETPAVASYEVFEPSLVFYHGRKVYLPREPQEVTKFFAEHADGLILTRADRLDQLPAELADHLVIVARQRRFLRRHDLVLLRQPEILAAGHQERQ